MNREKLANGLMWVSMAMLFIFSAAMSLTKGFHSDNNLLLFAAGACIIGLFYCAYKGISTILDAFFGK